MAPVLKRFKIESIESTSSIGTGSRFLKSSNPRRVKNCFICSFTKPVYCLKVAVAPGPHRFLERMDDLRAEEVRLPFPAPLEIAADFEGVTVDLAIREGVTVPHGNLLGDDFQIRALRCACRCRLKYLSTTA